MAGAIEANSAAIEAANAIDMKAGAQAGFQQRCSNGSNWTKVRISKIGGGLRDVAALPDPVGRLLRGTGPPEWTEVAKNFHPHWCHRHHL
jgi:glutamate-5-semialdehyde dehydrogenase